MASKQNYDIYRHELAVIVKFIKIYSPMLNADHQFILYTDHKPFVGFFNLDYYKNIFARSANKLRLFSICIQRISGKQNVVADNLSQVIFNNIDCSPD